MQCHLETDELTVLADELMEQVGVLAAEHMDVTAANDLLDKVLARDLRFDSDEFEYAAQLLNIRRQAMREELKRRPDPALAARLAILERTLEKLDEACAML